MNMNKRFLSLTLAFLMVLGSLASLAPVLAAETAADFTDVKETDWFFADVNKAVKNGLVKGYEEDNTFKPRNNLKRAEMATILARGYKLEEEASLDQFTDVKSTDWYYSAMARAVEAGIFKGDDNKLMPEQDIRRDHAFATVARAMGLEKAEDFDKTFPDVARLDKSVKGEVAALVNLGFVEGDETGKLNPEKSITRAEMTKIINLALEYEPATPEEQLKALKEAAEKLKEEDYTKETWKALEEALALPETTEEEVIAKVEAIETAIAGLEKVEVVTGKLQVTSVNAINAKHIGVNFNKPVDYDTARDTKNYIITHNENKYGEDFGKTAGKNVKEVYLANDSKTIVFELKEDYELDNGDRFSVDVKTAVKGVDGESVEAYGDDYKEFNDVDAPEIVNTTLKGNTVRVQYNEPVSLSDKDFGVNIDGIVIYDNKTNVNKKDSIFTTGTLYKQVKNAKDNVIEYIEYSVEIDLAEANLTAAELKDLTAEGTHDVTIYNMRDIVKRNGNGGNKEQIATADYTVAEGAKLEVEEINALDFNSLEVLFTKAPVTADIKVTKGSTVFYEKSRTEAKSIIDLPYTVLSETHGLTSLYGEDEDSVEVVVTVENYQDEDKVVGEKVVKTITLTREDGKPTVEKNSDHNLVIVEKWDDEGRGILGSDPVVTIELDKGTDTSAIELVKEKNVSVLDKDGIERTIKSVEVVKEGKAELLKVTLERDTGAKKQNFKDLLPLTVVVDEKALKVDSDMIDVWSQKKFDDVENLEGWLKGDWTNKLYNNKFDQEVNLETEDEDSKFKYVEAVEDVKISGDNKNVLTVTYNKAMDKSAANLANYKFDGKALPTGSRISMDSNSKVVTITLPKGSVAKTYNTRLQISQDVKTALGEILVGNVAQRENFMTKQQLKITDNTAPVIKDGSFLIAKSDDKVSKTIKAELSEEVEEVKVANAAQTLEFVPANSTKKLAVESLEYKLQGDDHILWITLEDTVNVVDGGVLRIKKDAKAENLMIDLAGNKIAEDAKYTIKGGEVDSGYKGDGDVPPLADKTELENAIAKAKALETADKTEDSVNALNQAIEAAEALAKDAKATEEEVNTVLANLVAAKDALEVIKPGVDNPKLENLVYTGEDGLPGRNIINVTLTGVENPEDYKLTYDGLIYSYQGEGVFRGLLGNTATIEDIKIETK